MPEWNDLEIYRTVLDSLQSGVYRVGRNRQIRFWKVDAEQITSYLRQDVFGRFLRDHLLTRQTKKWWGETLCVTSPTGGAGCRPRDELEALATRAAGSLEERIGKGGNCVAVLSGYVCSDPEVQTRSFRS